MNENATYSSPGRLSLLLALALLLCACSSDNGGGGEQEPPQQPLAAITFAGTLSEEQESTAGGGSETKAGETRAETKAGDTRSATRAATPLSDLNIHHFKVWAYKNMSYDEGTSAYGDLQTVMDGYTVQWTANTAHTTTTNTHNWDYIIPGEAAYSDQSIKYWDLSARAYRFFGTAPGKTGNMGTYSIVGSNGRLALAVDASSQTAIDNTPYFSTLWFSTGNELDYPERLFRSVVRLEFVKPVSRVRFMFKFVDGLTFGRKELSSIRFRATSGTGIPVKGTVTINYPLMGKDIEESWTSSPDNSGALPYLNIDYYEADADFTPDDTTTPAVYDNSPEHWYTVLPRTSQGSYTLSVVVVGGDPRTAVVPAEYMRWAPGYDYTYIFKIMEDGGVNLDQIQVAIGNWVFKDPIEHPVYNW